jgi:hypothetical protein
MYWGTGTAAGEACHDSIGLAFPHNSFYLPDGRVGVEPPIVHPDPSATTYETWTLVQNPNPVAVQVEVSYYSPDGLSNETVNATVDANSRRTFAMYPTYTGYRGAIKVRCLTAGRKIMAERAIYWSEGAGRTGGTDTVGSYSD